MVLGPILKWVGDTRGVSTTATGLLGVLVLLSGLLVIAVGAIRAFNVEVALPDEIAGFSVEQICLCDAFASFLWTFAYIFESGTKIGLHVTWLGAAVATTGAALAMRQPAAPPPPAPPAQGGGW